MTEQQNIFYILNEWYFSIPYLTRIAIIGWIFVAVVLIYLMFYGGKDE